jgi:hypothetical protein
VAVSGINRLVEKLGDFQLPGGTFFLRTPIPESPGRQAIAHQLGTLVSEVAL